MKGSVDLIAARRVADYLGTDHTEVILTETEMFTAIPDTVYQIESYDTTTVRASTPMFLLCKWIKQHTDITVIFSGEGSDEASGSYQYFHGAPNPAAFQGEIERLMADLSYFDVLRCDKCSAGAGLEVRVPFLDRDFLQYYCQINPALKIPGRGVGRQRMEKRLLRLACQDLLPDDIAWRSKEGMSDGVSTMEKPWYSVIQDRVSQLHPTSDSTDEATGFNPPQFPEAAYYRSIFNQHYQGRDTTIPYYWLPRWSGNTKDPSARKLATYQSSTLEKTSNQKNLSIT
jgi:asparagine synthase (glutamine-hydrolysing)